MKTAKTCPNCRRRTMGSASKAGAFCRSTECGWMSVTAHIASERTRTKAKREALATWEARHRELRDAVVEAAMAWSVSSGPRSHRGAEPRLVAACGALFDHEAAKPGGGS